MLDKSKPYGQVCGNAKHAFEQNGKLYNAQGDEVDSSGKLVDVSCETPEIEVKLLTDADMAPPKDTRAELVELIDKMNIKEIQKQLDKHKIEYNKKSPKADLVAMLVEEELAE